MKLPGFLPTFCLTAALLLSFAFALAAEPWEQVMKDRERSVEIDRTSIIQSDSGTKVAWGRIVLAEREAAEAGYFTIKALNRYDCYNRSFFTIKRVYLDSQQIVLREESVMDQSPVLVARNTVDERMWREVCAPPSAEDLRKIASDAVAKGSAAAGAPIVTAAPPTAPEAPAAKPGEPKSGDAKRGQVDGATAAKSPREDAGRTTSAPAKPDALMKAAASGEAKLDAKAEAARMAAERAEARRQEAERKQAEREAVAQRETERRAAAERSAKARAAAAKAAAEKAAAEKAAAEQAARAALAAKGVQWSYEGETGPAHWGKLRPEWAMCSEGARQSPIDLREGIAVDLEPVQFDYRETRFRIIDTGQTLQVDVGPGMGAEIRGVRYELEFLRFHRPSLERVGGQASSMVVNLHHKAADGRVAIVAMMLESDGAEHPLIQTLWNSLPLERGSHYMPDVAIDLAALVPHSPSHYLYMGSLPTPPCTEGVLWVVMKEPVKMSETQLGIFARLYPRNGRPIQPSNGRLILESR